MVLSLEKKNKEIFPEKLCNMIGDNWVVVGMITKGGGCGLWFQGGEFGLKIGK